jgi:hypothetical protein
MSRISKNNYDLNEMILYMKKENLKIKKFIWKDWNKSIICLKNHEKNRRILNWWINRKKGK